MAYNSTKLGRLYVRQQTNYETPFSSSAVISPTAPYGDGNPSDYFAVEAEVFMPPTTREIFERAAVKGGFYEIPPVSGSQHGAEFTISKPLVGLSSSALAADPTPHADSVLLTALLGGSVSTNYSANAVDGSSSTTSHIDILGAQAGDFTAGAAFLIGGDGGFIKTKNASDIEPIIELKSAPAAGETSFGSAMSYLTTGVTNSFTMVWRAKENQTQMVLQSCVPTSATITLGPKDDYPRLEVTFVCNAMASETADEAITDYDYSFPVLPVPTSESSARMVFQTANGAAGATELDIEGLQISITQELVPQLSHNSTSGVADMLVTNRAVEVSFKGVLGAANPFDSTGKILTDISNSSTKAIQCQIGGTSGQAFMMLIPAPIQTEVPAVEDMGGVFGLSFMFKPGNYGGAGVTVEDSDFRLAFL